MTDAEIRQVFESHVPGWIAPGERLLLVVPDTTRSAPMARLMGLLLPVLRDKGCGVTVLVALGTHPPLSHDELVKHLGPECFTDGVRVVNHSWDDPDAVMTIGRLSADEISELSGGLMAEDVELRINREISAADRMIFLHPVFPHELVGFSGGAKYLFPGISGPEMIDIVHWLGALLSSGNVIGKIDTPSRRVLDAAAAKMPLPMHGLSFVYHEGEVVAMEAGELQVAWKRAAAESQRRHITYKPRGFRKLLACCPPMYKDAWTAGKCVYKCEPVVADGGELVVYAPHVKTFSETHEEAIRAMGYHVRDYFLAHMDRYAHLPRSIMTHCVIVKGEGTYESGVERPRIRVLLASQIKPEGCETAGLGYVDPATIDPAEWMNREEEGILYVERAGEMLYRVTS
jgi:lactate racemase